MVPDSKEKTKKESYHFDKGISIKQAIQDSSHGDGDQLKSCKTIIKQATIPKEFIKGKYNESFHDGLYRFQDQNFENSKSNGRDSSSK
jgi:hypothetical protein